MPDCFCNGENSASNLVNVRRRGWDNFISESAASLHLHWGWQAAWRSCWWNTDPPLALRLWFCVKVLLVEHRFRPPPLALRVQSCVRSHWCTTLISPHLHWGWKVVWRSHWWNTDSPSPSHTEGVVLLGQQKCSAIGHYWQSVWGCIHSAGPLSRDESNRGLHSIGRTSN